VSVQKHFSDVIIKSKYNIKSQNVRPGWLTMSLISPGTESYIENRFLIVFEIHEELCPPKNDRSMHEYTSL